MTINIEMLTPQNGDRQVNKDTNLEFSITSSEELLLATLNVKVNGLRAVELGEIQDLANPFTATEGPTRFLTLTNDVVFAPGEKIQITTETESIDNTIVSIDNNTIKVRDAVNSTSGSVASLARGFTGTASQTSATDISISLDPSFDFSFDSVVLIIVEITSASGLTQRKVFTFRTSDTTPPQVFNFPSTIENSQLSFKLVDILSNQVIIPTLNVFINGSYAIRGGAIQSDYTGSLIPRNSSEWDVALRPRTRFLDQDEIQVDVQIADAYSNLGSFHGTTQNRTLHPQIQFVDIFPKEESTINPLDPKFLINVQTDQPIDPRFLNVSFIIDDTENIITGTSEHPYLSSGSFIEGETGTLVVGRDISIKVDRPQALSYNQKVTARVFFQEVSAGVFDINFFQTLTGADFDIEGEKLLWSLFDSQGQQHIISYEVVDGNNSQVDPTTEAQLITIEVFRADTAATIALKTKQALEEREISSNVVLEVETQDQILIIEDEKVEAVQEGTAPMTLITKIPRNDPLAAPFFERRFSYNTISTRLGPTIDSFLPTSTEIVAPSSTISFRAISFIEKDPIDLSSLNVVVNNQLAIDQGALVNDFTGSISFVDNSEGNSIKVSLQPSSPFEIGSTIDVSVEVKDQAGNLSLYTSSFTIANTNIPNITLSPIGGVYNELIRVSIQADQEAQIFYTLDGSVPQVGKVNTFVGASPISNVPVFSQGITQIKALAVSSANIAGPIITEIYDVNQFPPEIIITSPVDQAVQDLTTAAVEYEINLERGFLSKVEYSINSGPKIDTENTLRSSSISITGLTSGSNLVEIFATDNAGNLGIGSINILVNPSSINDFTLKFAPLECPKFTTRNLSRREFFNNFIDTATVVLIGYGRRTETKVEFAIGSGEDGEPKDFLSGGNPDGRHFELNSFPILDESLIVTLFRKGRNITLNPRDYVLNSSSGQIVLDHPLETGESLTIQYISLSDINSPELYTPNQERELFNKHGSPSVENSLSLAAQIAFENGATRILAVQPLPLSQDSGWNETFKVLTKDEGYWIVPILNNQDLSNYSTIRANAFNHSIETSKIGNRKERVVVASRINLEENTFNSERMTLVYVDQDPKITRIINNQATLLNPTFIAGAVAGHLSSFGNKATPITNKKITGFTLGSNMRSPRIDQDKITRAGFTLVQPLATGATVYRGRTSTLSGSPILEEISIQRTIDYISKNTRRLLENAFTGASITNNLTDSMETTLRSFLSSQDSIASAEIISIVRDLSEPRQVNVSLSIVPLFPLNSLTIGINITATI